jgi:hypothetical protein
MPLYLETISRELSVFLIGLVGGGVQLCPLGTAATNRPIVPVNYLLERVWEEVVVTSHVYRK